jgi:hypothetical protein
LALMRRLSETWFSSASRTSCRCRNGGIRTLRAA